ncbi:MAG: 16S rRNA (cytosine(1402)-N(4))-methyltransferase RsmH [candidate division NC10 bacterium]|nr:16S rRNA (cytosine(1402)-N(4))-methyltransferase RsmH [candidate division NC10 bacterium]
MERLHIPVLLREVLELLRPAPGGRFLDCTVGLGGHAEAILEAGGPETILCGIDRDAEALALAEERLDRYRGQAQLVHGDFRELWELAREHRWASFDSILFDLGVSSFQLGNPERGFSFFINGPLDMRMDRSGGSRTAAELLAVLSEKELAGILWEFGEERFSRRIARAIVRKREQDPITSTKQLKDLVERTVPRSAWPRKIHPATRTFQALRIAVNDELSGLSGTLEEASALLKPGGRLVVIAFHSLEDRIVKETFRRLAGQEPSAFRLLTKKPVVPSEEEREQNPRSRSAKLRALEKVAN